MTTSRKALAIAFAFAFASAASYADGTYVDSWIGLSGTVTIPSSCETAPVPANQIADFANVTKIVFESANSAVTASGLTAKQELVLNAELSGAGGFSVVNCGKVTINSDNQNFKGRFYIENSPVYVSKRYGLGSAADGTGPVGANGAKAQLVFTGTGDDLRFENCLMATNSVTIKPNSTTDTLIITTNLTHGTANGFLLFQNKNKIVGGTTKSVSGHIYPQLMGGELWFDENATVKAGSGSIYFYASAANSTYRLDTTNIIASTSVAFYTSGGSYVCGQDELFTHVSSGFIFNQSPAVGVFDLNGTTQTIVKIGSIGTHKWTVSYPFTSKTPATLVLAPTAAGHQTSGECPIFSGKASVKLAATGKGATVVNSFAADAADDGRELISTSTGTFTVETGIIEFKHGWGWGGNVVVKDAGDLRCNSLVSLNSGVGSLKVEGHGKLTIGAGVTLKVSDATIGNATLARYQTYSVADINELDIGDTTITGEGFVYVGAPSVLDDWKGWPSSGEARIPNGTVVDVTDADVANVANLSSIVLGLGATVRCVNATTPLTISATVVGAGTVAADGSKGVTLAGDFSDIAARGGYSFKDAAVTVAGANKLAVDSAAMFAGECWLSLAGTASLEIAEGVEVLVYGGTFGSAELEHNRIYTTAELNALSAANPVTGAGTLRVGPKHIPGTWQGWPDAGTATKAEIPDGETADILDGDVEKVAALSTIEMGVGAKILYKSATTPLTLTGSLFGSGLFVADNGAPLTLAGDNSRLIAPGAFAVTSTAVTVTHRYGLGGPRTGAALFVNTKGGSDVKTIDREKNTLLFGDGTSVLTNEVPIHYVRSWVIGSTSAAYRFVQRADFLRVGCKDSGDYLYPVNGFVMSSGTYGTIDGALMVGGYGADHVITFEPESRFRVVNKSQSPCAYYDLYGRTLEINAQEVTASTFIPCTITKVLCQRANVFDGVNEWWPYTTTSVGNWTDLNGLDQRLPRLGYQTIGTGWYYVFKSATPATLTVSNKTAKASKTSPARFEGCMSVHFAGTDDYTIPYAVSTTKGTLSVSGGGSVAFTQGAAFSGAKQVAIDNATVIVAADARADGVFSKRAIVTVANGGNLKLYKNETVSALKEGSGYVEKGVYGAPGSGAAKTLDCLAGSTGTLTVRRNGPCGLVIIVR